MEPRARAVPVGWPYGESVPRDLGHVGKVRTRSGEGLVGLMWESQGTQVG